MHGRTPWAGIESSYVDLFSHAVTIAPGNRPGKRLPLPG